MAGNLETNGRTNLTSQTFGEAVESRKPSRVTSRETGIDRHPSLLTEAHVRIALDDLLASTAPLDFIQRQRKDLLEKLLMIQVEKKTQRA